MKHTHTHFNRRTLLLIVLLGFILSGIMLATSLLQNPQQSTTKAAGSVNYILVPSKETVNPGEQFDVFVNIIPNNTPITASEIQINFDSQKLETINQTPIALPSTPFFDTILPNCTLSTPPNCPSQSTVQNGRATIFLGSNCTNTTCTNPPTTGTHTIAILKLRAKTGTSGTASIQLIEPQSPDPGSTIPMLRTAGKNQGNVNQTGTLTNTTIAIGTTTNPVNVNFQIRLEAIYTKRDDITANIILKQGTTTVSSQNLSFSANDNGIYQNTSPLSGISPGVYDIYIDGPVHLTKKYSNQTLVAGNNTLNFTSTFLFSGDIFDDEIINVNDYNDVVTFYGCSKGQLTLTDRTCTYLTSDLDLNGVINVSDYNSIIANYTLRGD